MKTDALPLATTQTLSPDALTGLDAREFYRQVGEINTAYAQAEDVFRDAQDNLRTLLTEQVARHTLAAHPSADLLCVRVAAEYHHGEDDTRATGCEGHHERLVPFEVIDIDGFVLGGFNALSPVMYLLERLSPMLGLEDQVLDIAAREWAVDCTND